MNLFWHYLLRSFTRFLALALLTFVGLYLLIDFFEKIDDLLEKGRTFGQCVLFFVAEIPMIIEMVLPLAVLLATFLTLGSLSRSNELVAIQSVGISLWRLAMPLLAVGLALSLGLMAVSEYITPMAAKTFTRLRKGEAKATHNVWLRTGTGFLHIERAHPKTGQIKGITLYTMDDGFKVRQRVTADTATFIDDTWRLHGAKALSFSTDGVARSLSEPPKIIPRFDRLPKDFKDQERRSYLYSLRELLRQKKRLQREGHPSRALDVDIHVKMAAPFACLVMAFLGIPFALKTGRKSDLATGLAISVLIGGTFFFINATVIAFGHAGAVMPVIAAWFTHGLFVLLGIWLLLSVRN